MNICSCNSETPITSSRLPIADINNSVAAVSVLKNPKIPVLNPSIKLNVMIRIEAIARVRVIF